MSESFASFFVLLTDGFSFARGESIEKLVDPDPSI